MKISRSGFEKYLSLSGSDRRLFLEALFTQVVTGLLLKIVPFRQIPRLFGNPVPATPGRESAVGSQQSLFLERVRTATRRASRISPWKNKCLVSSLAVRCMLRRRRIDSKLSLGLAKNDGGMVTAHAWINSGDIELVEKTKSYQELYSF